MFTGRRTTRVPRDTFQGTDVRLSLTQDPVLRRDSTDLLESLCDILRPMVYILFQGVQGSHPLRDPTGYGGINV